MFWGKCKIIDKDGNTIYDGGWSYEETWQEKASWLWLKYEMRLEDIFARKN